MGGVLCLKFTDPTILDAQDVTGGAVFLRLGASWVVFCASSSRMPPFSMHRASPVVRCSSGLGRHGWCSVPQVQAVLPCGCLSQPRMATRQQLALFLMRPGRTGRPPQDRQRPRPHPHVPQHPKKRRHPLPPSNRGRHPTPTPSPPPNPPPPAEAPGPQKALVNPPDPPYSSGSGRPRIPILVWIVR